MKIDYFIDASSFFSVVVIVNFAVSWCKVWGPFFERPGNFSGPKANFEIQMYWIVAPFLAHKSI